MNLETDKNPEFSDFLYSPNTKWQKPNTKWLKLPSSYSFNLETAREEFDKVRKKHALKPFEVYSKSGRPKPFRSYRGLGLTARPLATDAFYDALSLYGPGDNKLSIFNTFEKMSSKIAAVEREVVPLDESQFSIKTEAFSPYFQSIVEKFKSPFSKIRFLELMPSGIIPPHVDFPFYQGIRVHACLYSNSSVIWEVEGETFSIPCDGNFYWFDTGRYHAVKNMGDTSRVVLSINLLVYYDRAGNMLYSPHDDLLSLINEAKI